MRITHALARCPADEIVQRLEAENRRHAVDQRAVDIGAFTRLLAPDDRRLDGVGRIHAGENIDDGNADLGRRPVGLPRDMHDAAHALQQEVVAGARRIGAGLAKAGDRAIDDVGLHFLQPLVVQAEFLEAADLEILDHDIGVGGEPPHERAALFRVEIRLDAALAAIAAVEIGSAELFAIVRFHEGRAPLARIVALARALDFHDVGAEVGEELAGPGSGENAGEFEDAYTGERFGHFGGVSGLEN